MCLKNEEKFDAILLDAPCSSERHVLADPKYLSEWSPSRIKTLSMAQWALLSSAWRMLKPSGYLLYSTCALSPDENDYVVAKLLKKFDNVKVCEPKIALNYKNFTDSELPEYENTEFGAHVLPDKAGGAGPLYFCLLQKNHSNH
jgi:16S rRNA C967 or C1407 C5-methylase (RsmB/RsmF family)